MYSASSHLSRTFHRTPRSLRIAAAITLLPALVFTGCSAEDSDSPEVAERVAPHVEHYPELLYATAEEEAEAARRLVARLEVEDYGRVSIVDVGTDEDPEFAYFTVGGEGIADVMEQLLDAEATPAEVFVALSEGDEVPAALAADHELRAEAGDAENTPRARTRPDPSRTWSGAPRWWMMAPRCAHT